MSFAQPACLSMGSTERPMILTPRLSNSGLILAIYPSSVVQTGVKSLGCENSTAHLSPIQSWKRILPSVVSASKSGAVSLIARAITHLRRLGAIDFHPIYSGAPRCRPGFVPIASRYDDYCVSPAPWRRNECRIPAQRKNFVAVMSRRQGAPSRDRRQRRDDLGAAGLVPGRQLDRAAEGVLRLVQGEARIIGRDLEQHAARLAEVHRTEIAAIDLIGRA